MVVSLRPGVVFQSWGLNLIGVVSCGGSGFVPRPVWPSMKLVPSAWMHSFVPRPVGPSRAARQPHHDQNCSVCRDASTAVLMADTVALRTSAFMLKNGRISKRQPAAELGMGARDTQGYIHRKKRVEPDRTRTTKRVFRCDYSLPSSSPNPLQA